MAADTHASETPEKCCSRCRQVKPTTEFYRRARGKHGVGSICKPCNKAQVYAYRAANPDKIQQIQARYRAKHLEEVQERNRKWREAHPDYEREHYERRRADADQLATMRRTNARIGRERRAAIAASEGLSSTDVTTMLAQPCAYCWQVSTELDHVVPISAGGRHDINNVVSVCRTCNARKGNKSLLLFLLAQRRISERSLAHGTH